LKQDRANSGSTTIPVLSFFTGAGFLDLGFMRAGFSPVWHNEFDPGFVRGFEYGMGALLGSEHPVIENTQSIADLNTEQILGEAFAAQPPDLFGMIGGPPCPDFSVGGKNLGGTGARGQLSGIYLRKVLELKPTFFVMENVPGLVSTAKHREFLHELIQTLNEDYVTDYKILNALDFGVPQDRRRLFLVGFRRDWLASKSAAGFPLTWPRDDRFADAKKRFDWPSASPFGGKPTKPRNVPRELMVGTYMSDARRTASLPNGTDCFVPYSKKFNEVSEGDTSRKSFKRLHRWRYSPTVAYGNNEVHLHPYEARRLTVREALRLQSVPDGYALPPDMTLSQKFKTIANGVPVKLAEAVAAAIMDSLRP